MPGPKCVVLDCYKVKFPKSARIAYHKFPRDLELRQVWFQKIGIEDKNNEIGFVCSKHFKIEDYIRDLQAELLGYSGRRKLKPSAIPSINLPFEEDEISPEEKERLEREQHQKLIQDCLNGAEQQQTVLSFDLFKKLRYSNSRSRRGRKPRNPSRQTSGVVVFNVNPQQDFHENEGDSQVVVVTLPSGEEHIVHIKNLDNPTVEYSQDDSNLDLDLALDMPAETDDNTALDIDDPDYLRQRVKQLEDQVNHQKKIICSLRRQIIREKKMMEKVILATNSGQSLPPIYKRRIQYDEKSRAALLNIYSLAPHLYPRFSRLLNLPSKSVLSTWDPEVTSTSHQDSPQKALLVTTEEDFQESNFVEGEFIIQSEDFVQL